MILVVNENGNGRLREREESPQCHCEKPVSAANMGKDTKSMSAGESREEEEGVASVNDALVDVYPLALGFLPSAEIARLLPLCHALELAGREAMPSALADELRPILPVSLAKAIDDSDNSNDYWVKLARAWRRKSFVRAEANANTDDDASPPTGAVRILEYTDDLLEAFFSEPEVSECLVQDCDPAAFVSYLRDIDEGYDSLGGLRTVLRGAWIDDEVNDEDRPYHKLTETGVPNTGVRADKFSSFIQAVFKYAPGENHFLCIEITAEGGKPIRLEDGTPLAMWVNGEGRAVSPRKSSVSTNEKNEDIIEKLRHEIAPRCTCKDCNEILELVNPDRSMLWCSDLLLHEPYLTPEYRGCEKECYGRTVIKEDDLKQLVFGDSLGDPFEDIAPEEDEDYHKCSLPDVDSMNSLFEITIKAVRFDHNTGPSSVTIVDRAPLEIYERYARTEGQAAGATEYLFQTDENSTNIDIVVEVCFRNTAKLIDFSSDKFECDSRPKSNQLWIKDWGITIMKVDAMHAPEATLLPLSELLWRCGLVNGL